MTAIRIRTVLNSTKLDLPELAPLVGHRVEVIVQDEASASWPDGWFEAVEGAIEDPTLAPQAQPDVQVTAAEQGKAGKRWVESGPQGPIDDDDTPFGQP